jgi:hypothetical protein
MTQVALSPSLEYKHLVGCHCCRREDHRACLIK